MYQWQTLTLARLEAAAKSCPPTGEFASGMYRNGTVRNLEIVKGLLYRIGMRYFSEPEVRVGCKSAHPIMTLRWDVDGRLMDVTVGDFGRCSIFLYRFGDRSSMATVFPGDAADAPAWDDAAIAQAVHWLLTGQVPPKAETDTRWAAAV